MKTVALTGGSGLIGGALVRRLREEGVEVVLLTRAESGGGKSPRTGISTLRWDPGLGIFPGGELEGIDALIHLAGEPLMALRWTRKKKERILQSREEGTHLVARGVARMERPPGVLISASAVGYYGDAGSEPLTESAPVGKGFLAEVCRRWEGAAEPLRQAGVRVVNLRTGFVLAREGGALKAMLPAFRMGLGGRFGDGDHYLPWIDLEDEVGLILHAIATPGLEGPLNATAPTPVTNSRFTQALGSVLRRPTLLPVPAPLLRLGLGEMGSELLLSGQRAIPEKALRSGYSFRFQDVEASLRHQLGKTR